MVCEAWARLSAHEQDKTSKIPPELLLRKLEITYKSPVRSPSVAVARIMRTDESVKLELADAESGRLQASAVAIFGPISYTTPADPSMTSELAILRNPPTSPHLSTLANLSSHHTPEMQHLLHADKPQQHSWMYRTFFGPARLESLHELHIGERSDIPSDELVSRWPNTILSSAVLGRHCSVSPEVPVVHPAPLWALMDHILAHSHVNSWGVSSVTAVQSMDFSISTDSSCCNTPAQIIGIGRSVSRFGRSGKTKGRIAIVTPDGEKVVVTGSAVMVDLAPQPSIEARLKVYGRVGDLRAAL